MEVPRRVAVAISAILLASGMLSSCRGLQPGGADPDWIAGVWIRVATEWEPGRPKDEPGLGIQETYEFDTAARTVRVRMTDNAGRAQSWVVFDQAHAYSEPEEGLLRFTVGPDFVDYRCSGDGRQLILTRVASTVPDSIPPPAPHELGSVPEVPREGTPCAYRMEFRR